MTQELTVAEYQALAFPRTNKYSAQRVTVDGVVFASKREAARYGELLLLQQAGEIRDLVLQPRYLLLAAFTDSDGVKHRRAEYVGDFGYVERGGLVVCEDAKGFSSQLFRLKWKLVKWMHPTVTFRLV